MGEVLEGWVNVRYHIVCAFNWDSRYKEIQIYSYDCCYFILLFHFVDCCSFFLLSFFVFLFGHSLLTRIFEKVIVGIRNDMLYYRISSIHIDWLFHENPTVVFVFLFDSSLMLIA